LQFTPLEKLLSFLTGFIFPSAIKVPAIILSLGSALLAYILGHWLDRNKSGAFK
jgi:hypothetical protein